uniref:Peptidase A1 domain-containing protein n=1 Tax=Steinernema glaseri TaxID=37863 RepID=A0A1I7YS13_9BILA
MKDSEKSVDFQDVQRKYCRSSVALTILFVVAFGFATTTVSTTTSHVPNRTTIGMAKRALEPIAFVDVRPLRHFLAQKSLRGQLHFGTPSRPSSDPCARYEDKCKSLILVEGLIQQPSPLEDYRGFVNLVTESRGSVGSLGSPGFTWSAVFSLKYQSVSAFWETDTTTYLFALEPLYIYPNNVFLLCETEKTCFCYEAVGIDESNPSEGCPPGFAALCFSQPHFFDADNTDTTKTARIHTPGGKTGRFQYIKEDKTQSYATNFVMPRALQLHLDGGVAKMYAIEESVAMDVPMPAFKYFYGYREDSDVPEPVVQVSTAGCKSNLRLAGFVHGDVYNTSYSERKRAAASGGR